MKGFVEVYKTGKMGKELIYEDHNMIVDGAGEHIASFLARDTPPSSMDFSGNLQTSSFNIRAMTLGGPHDTYEMRDTLFYPSSILENVTAYTKKDRRHNLLAPLNNYNFSSYGPPAFSLDKRRVQLLYDTSLTGTLSWGEDLLEGKGYFDNWKPDNDNPDKGNNFRGWVKHITHETPNIGTGPFIEPLGGGVRFFRPPTSAPDEYDCHLQVPGPDVNTYISAGAIVNLLDGTIDFTKFNSLRDNTQYYKITYDLIEAPLESQFMVWNSTSGISILSNTPFTNNYTGDRILWNMEGSQKQRKMISEVYPLMDRIYKTSTDEEITSFIPNDTSYERYADGFKIGLSSIMSAEADVTLGNIKVFAYGDDSGGDWDLDTLGAPSIIQSPEGMSIDSIQRGDQVTLKQRVGLETGGTYNVMLEGSGTDNIEVRLYRVDTKYKHSFLKEYYDFDRNTFLPKQNTFIQFPEATIPLTAEVRTHEKTIHLPKHKIDDSVEDFRYEYVIEIVVPKDSNDKFSHTYLRKIELYDESEKALRNPRFKIENSILTNGELSKTSPITAADAANPEACNALGLVNVEGWTSNNHLTQSNEPALYFETSGSVRWESGREEGLGDEVSNDGSIVLRSMQGTWDSEQEAQALLLSPPIIKPEDIEGDLELSFLFKVARHAGSTGLRVALTAHVEGTQYYYCFSGNTNAGTGTWQDATTATVDRGDWSAERSITSGVWEMFSQNVSLDTLPPGTPTHFHILIIPPHGPNAYPDWNDTYLKDFSLGGLDNWTLSSKVRDAVTSDSSYFQRVLGGGIISNFVESTAGKTSMKSDVTEILPEKRYFLVFDYTPNSIDSTEAFEVTFKHKGTTDTYCDLDAADGTWNSTEQPIAAPSSTLGTRKQWIAGPIIMDGQGFSVEDTYELEIRQSTGSDSNIEFHEVKVVDGAHILYTAPYKVTALEDNLADGELPLEEAPLILHNGWLSHAQGPPFTNLYTPYINQSLLEESYLNLDVQEGNATMLYCFGKLKDSPFKQLKRDGSYHKYVLSLGDYTSNMEVVGLFVEARNSSPNSASGFNWFDDAWTPGRNPFNVSADVNVDYPFTERTTPSFFIDSSLPEDTIISVGLYTGAQLSPGNVDISQFKVYETFETAEFTNLRSYPPSPADSTLQPVSPGAGKLGHFLNYIEFSGTPESSGLTTPEILQHGCYLPGSGIYMHEDTFGDETTNDFSGVLSGTLNKTGVLNSDGFIMPSPVAIGSQTIADSSAGFVTSAFGDLSATREVKYILTLDANEWKFLDYYYGGIGNIGLWTIDYEATAKKLGGEFGKPPFIEPETGTPYTESLYNLTDSTKNPVYKLFAKKVFAPGGLKIPEGTAYDEHLTIVWGIKF